MSEKKIKARLQQKHDTSANWALATNFKPKAGELIIYDDLKKMKVGDGETLVNNLPFLSADVSQDLNNYVNLADNQTISGAKTFTSHVVVANANNLQNKTAYEYSSILRYVNNTTYSLLLPSKSGLIALTSDIPSTSSFVTVSGDQTISGAKTFTGTINIEGEADSGSFCNVSVDSTGFIRYYEEDDNTEVVLNMPITQGETRTYTIATTNDVNNILTSSNTYTGITTFNTSVYCKSGVLSTNYNDTFNYAFYAYDSITRHTSTVNYKLTLPTKTGTIALTSDIPSTSNLVTTNTDQTITGVKTFNAPANISGTEQVTTKFMTSNGGSISIGKEGPNSGTMLRFKQNDSGADRLLFRASSTAGAMVWEQPEKNAALYFDMGNSAGSGVNRVTLRNVAGTLALTKELPAAVSANPTLSGSETELTGLQIGSTKYKIVTQTYVDNAIGNIDTLLTAINTGTGV